MKLPQIAAPMNWKGVRPFGLASLTVVFVTLVWGPIPALAVGGLSKSARPPNIVVILADDLGYGDLGSYGSTKISTPRLDALAKRGARFSDFHTSAPVCSPTRAGFLTGRYHERAGIHSIIRNHKAEDRHLGLQPQEITVAPLLRNAGYRSGLVGKWHLGTLDRFSPLRHGFELFRGFRSGTIDYINHIDRAGKSDWWKQDELAPEAGYSTHLIGRHAVEFVEAYHRQPFFLFVSHAAPHSPYQGPDDPAQRVLGKFGDGKPVPDKDRAYREMVEEMDRGVGELVDTLERLAISDRTLIVFFSDNGATRKGSNAPLRGFKRSLLEGGHRVPAIVSWPGRISGGRLIDATASSIDWMPTILSIAGAEVPDGHYLDGIDLSRVLLDNAQPSDRLLFWKFEEQRAVRHGRWKLYRATDEDHFKLYDLTADLAESRDLASQHPEQVMALSQALERWENEVARDATLQLQLPESPP
jgi:arylsulfatase A